MMAFSGLGYAQYEWRCWTDSRLSDCAFVGA